MACTRPTQPNRPAWYGDQRIGSRTRASLDRGPGRGGRLAADNRHSGAGPAPADLVLLDRNLLALDAESIAAGALAQTHVRMTVFDGEIVWE